MIFDGMHPLVRQIPPGSSLSMTAILILGFSRIKTSTKFIAEPEPMTIRSYSSMATPVPHRCYDGKALHTALAPGSVLVVTAHTEIRHDLTMQPSQQGRNARWLSIVLRLPWHTEAPPNALQVKDAGDVVEAPDGTTRRPVTGPLARAETFMGLESTDIEFSREAEASFSIARKRRGVAYVLRGSGMIEKSGVEKGQGALFENVTRLSMRGSPDFRVFLATVPLAESRAKG